MIFEFLQQLVFFIGTDFPFIFITQYFLSWSPNKYFMHNFGITEKTDEI